MGKRGGGREHRGRREGRELRREGREGWEISPPRSFLKVGTYGLDLLVTAVAAASGLLCLLWSDVVILGNGMAEVSMSVAEFYVLLFRRHRLHRNEREAVWSSVDQLITMQLMAAEQNKLVP